MEKIDYGALLDAALDEPGELSNAYQRFSSYSITNCFLAWQQLDARGMSVQPIATYKKWASLGRQVKKGAKAISLCVPQVVKKECDNGDFDKSFTFFKMLPRFFALCDTDGDEYSEVEKLPSFSGEKCIENLGIKQVDFAMAHGNIQGYAVPSQKKIAINPLAKYKIKTFIHEVAHCLMHADDIDCLIELPRNIKEVEAEAVAYIVLSATGYDDADCLSSCRAYIQGWLKNEQIEQRSIKAIFTAVDKIIKAGKA